MTVLTTNNVPADRALLHSAARFAANLFRGMFAGYDAYMSYSNLNRMSDRQLADIGLTRTDIPRAAATEILGR